MSKKPKTVKTPAKWSNKHFAETAAEHGNAVDFLRTTISKRAAAHRKTGDGNAKPERRAGKWSERK